MWKKNICLLWPVLHQLVTCSLGNCNDLSVQTLYLHMIFTWNENKIALINIWLRNGIKLLRKPNEKNPTSFERITKSHADFLQMTCIFIQIPLSNSVWWIENRKQSICVYLSLIAALGHLSTALNFDNSVAFSYKFSLDPVTLIHPIVL